MFSNNDNLPLSLSVFLAHDEYPEPREGVISATTLLKPIKQIILGMRLSKDKAKTIDISSRMASTYGTALHNGIEAAWKSDNLVNTFQKLGYPLRVAERIVVNPADDELEDCIPIYTELRTEKKFKGWTISGEFDFVAEGRLRDFKSTGVYTYTNKTNDEKYKLQGSIYRWLNPTKITDDVMAIDYIFTDWSGLAAHTQRDKYPPMRMMEQLFTMLSYEETEKYIADKLTLIDTLRLEEEHLIPACTNEDLWVAPSTFKYYKNPAKTARATRVYDTHHEAMAHFSKDGRVGIVMENKGAVKACKYCDAVSICQQAQRYINSGELKL